MRRRRGVGGWYALATGRMRGNGAEGKSRSRARLARPEFESRTVHPPSSLSLFLGAFSRRPPLVVPFSRHSRRVSRRGELLVAPPPRPLYHTYLVVEKKAREDAGSARERKRENSSLLPE